MDKSRNTSTRRLRRGAFSLLLATVATWAALTFVESRERAWAQEAEALEAAQLPTYPVVPTIGEVFAGMH